MGWLRLAISSAMQEFCSQLFCAAFLHCSLYRKPPIFWRHLQDPFVGIVKRYSRAEAIRRDVPLIGPEVHVTKDKFAAVVGHSQKVTPHFVTDLDEAIEQFAFANGMVVSGFDIDDHLIA